MELAPGTQLGKYTIEALAGRGGMGVVYKARQQRPARTVALKVIAPDLAQDDSFRKRFERESEIAAQIEHPNVIPVHEVDEADGLLYLTMRYVEGGTDLRQLILRHGRLPAPRAAEIVAQVASALDAAHRRGLVHRDIKPANVLIADDDGRDHAYLTDFGLTKQSTGGGDGLTQTGMFVGTLDYIAPEQLEGKDIDARTDVYALGCVLYQAVTGRVPFDRDSDVQKMFAHMNEPPPSAATASPEVPPALDAVIARAMAKKPEDRFGTAGELGRAALAAARGGAAVAAPPTALAGGATVHAPQAPAPPTPPPSSVPGGQTVHAAGAGAGATVHSPAGPAVPGSTPAGGQGGHSWPLGTPGPDTPPPLAPGSTPGGPASQPPGGGYASPPPPRPAGGRGPKRGLLIGGAVAALAAIVLVLVLVLGGGEDTPDGPTPEQDRQAVAQVIVDYFAREDAGNCDNMSDTFVQTLARSRNAPAGTPQEARQSCLNNVNNMRSGTLRVTIDSVDVQGDRATSQVTFPDQQNQKSTVGTVRQNGRWLMDSQS